MPPKAAKGKTTKKKSSKPEWMSENVWAVSQDLPLLFASFAGVKSDKAGKSGKPDRPATPSKTGKGGKPEPPPPIPKAQAGLILWQQLLPKKASDEREELLKLDVAGVAVKTIASGVLGDMTPACGVLNCIANHSEAARELIFAARPAVVPNLLNALSLGSPSLAAAAVGVLKTLATAPDTRPRMMKATKDWNWKPLIDVLEHEDDLPQCGTNLAATDGVLMVYALVASDAPSEPPPTAASKAAAAAVVSRFLEADGISALLRVCKGRHSGPSALASAAHTLLFLVHKFPDRSLQPFSSGGVQAVAAVVQDSRVTLRGRACAAGCLKLYMARTPQELSAQQPSAEANIAAPAAAVPSQDASQPPAHSEATPTAQPSTSAAAAAGASQAPSAPETASSNLQQPAAAKTSVMPAAAAAARAPKPLGSKAQTKAGVKGKVVAEAPSFALGWFADSGEDYGEERLWLEEQMLVADGVKDKVLARVHEVAHSQAVPELVEMCNGPEGPLAAVDLNAPLPPPEDKKKKGKKPKAKAKGKKAGKLEDGMAEAQAQAAGCLRLLSLSDLVKVDLMAAGAVRFLTPLLDSKVNQARWNARQALFNLAMLPEHVSIMTRYKVPNYIHMGNMPASHLRPLTAPPALSQRMARLGLTGTAPARPSATAPAAMASLISGLGDTSDPVGSRRGSTAAPNKLSSVAAFPSLGMTNGSGMLFPSNLNSAANSNAAALSSPRLALNTTAAFGAFPSPLGAAPGTPRGGLTAGWSDEVAGLPLTSFSDRPMTAGSPLGMTAGSPLGMTAGTPRSTLGGVADQALGLPPRPSTAAVPSAT